jgi:hypothetical protein
MLPVRLRLGISRKFFRKSFRVRTRNPADMDKTVLKRFVEVIESGARSVAKREDSTTS